MRINIETDFKFPKKTVAVIGGIALLVVAGFLGYSRLSNKNPIPDSVKKQISFTTVYPKNSSTVYVNQSSYSYQPAQKTFSYTAKINGIKTVVSEQPAPSDAQENSIVYYQSLGLHPVAQINSKNGLAVLVNFYDAGTFGSEGQNAVFVKDGTLLIAHPDGKISNEDWKSFFDNLKISK